LRKRRDRGLICNRLAVTYVRRTALETRRTYSHKIDHFQDKIRTNTMAHIITVTTVEAIGEVPEYIVSAVRTLCKCGQKIEAIRLVRDYVRRTYPHAVNADGNYKFGLIAAKNTVEYLSEGFRN